MWRRLHLPGVDGPIRGFTFPRRDSLFILMPDGLVRVTLDPLQVQRLAPAETLTVLAEEQTGWLVWQGELRMIYGPDGGDITLCDHPCGDRMVPDVDGTLLITDPDEREVRQRIESVRLPTVSSWLWAGFSEDGRWLVAGEPDGMQVFGRVPNSTGTLSSA